MLSEASLDDAGAVPELLDQSTESVEQMSGDGAYDRWAGPSAVTLPSAIVSCTILCHVIPDLFRAFLVLQSQIRQEPFEVVLLGAGLVATSPPRPVQDEIRRLAFRPNKAGEQPAHLGSSHGNWRATAPIPPWYSPAHLSRFPGCSGPSGAAGTVQMPRRARLQVIGDNVDTPAVGGVGVHYEVVY